MIDVMGMEAVVKKARVNGTVLDLFASGEDVTLDRKDFLALGFTQVQEFERC
jgi:hypothetical protein